MFLAPRSPRLTVVDLFSTTEGNRHAERCFCRTNASRQDRDRPCSHAILRRRRAQGGPSGVPRRRGITRESVWIQQTPSGDFAVIYLAATADNETVPAGLLAGTWLTLGWKRQSALTPTRLSLGTRTSGPQPRRRYCPFAVIAITSNSRTSSPLLVQGGHRVIRTALFQVGDAKEVAHRGSTYEHSRGSIAWGSAGGAAGDVTVSHPNDNRTQPSRDFSGRGTAGREATRPACVLGVTR
jgi:hypothetical protein